MKWLVEKMGDVKLKEMIKSMLLDMSEQVTPKFISLQVIKYAATAKAPKIHQESCTLLIQIIDEFGIGAVPLKETIDYGKVAAN